MLRIILKDLKTFFGNKTVLFWSFILPIALTLFLGNALTMIFPSVDNLNTFFRDVKIEYVSDGDQFLTEAFTGFLRKTEQEIGLSYRKSPTINKSIDRVRKREINLAVEIDSANVFTITKNREFKSELAENLMFGFLEKYQLMETVSRKGEGALTQEVLAELDSNNNYLAITSLNREKRDSSALDYFGIVNVFAFVFWTLAIVIPLFNSEVKAGLFGRLRISGISKSSYLFSKLISISIFLAVVTLAIFVFNVLVFKVYLGNSLMLLIPLLLSTVILAAAIAILIIAWFTKLEEGGALLELVTPIVVFLGGGFLPILDFSSEAGLNAIGRYTPLFVQNRAAFGLINGGNFSIASGAFQYNLTWTIILIVIAIIVFNRKE